MIRELGLGGSERQAAAMALALDRARFEPHVGCFRPDGPRGDELRSAGIPIVQFPVRSLYKPSTLAAARLMRRYIKAHDIRLVHTFDVPTTLFGVPAARTASAPVVVSSLRASRDLTPGLVRGLLRLTDRMVDGVVTNCEAMRRHLIEAERVPAGLVHLCYNGIDLDEFQPRAMDQPRGGAPIVVGTVCALRAEKDLRTLLEAFSELRRIRPNVRLVIVGSGPELPALQAHRERLGLENACVFEAGTGRVAPWYRAIDIFVLPSVSEALSNSLMEAMACGCAAVASAVGGNVELLQEGQTGLLYDAGQADQLARLLLRLVDDGSLRVALADRGTRFVRETFSVTAATARLADIYTALLS
jgi:glycosyltransferase involved in cell wall biosynthesis